ncbi:MAG: hypothetical protein IJ074_13020, partial [Clostridia bacterium]|nr:hypothetical protein [Clostridia bacterium]
LDASCEALEAELRPLNEWMADVAAVVDLTDLLRLRVNAPMEEWLDAILCAWVRDDVFLDPAGEGMTRKLSGLDVFRIGDVGGDEAVRRLGARLYERKPIASAALTGRLMEADTVAATLRCAEQPPRLKCGSSRGCMRMISRVDAYFFAMTGAAGGQNAGDLWCFYGANSVFAGGSVPLPAQTEQLPAPEGECAASMRVERDHEQMTMDLTNAYPKEACVESLQRTLLVLRGQRCVRVIDAIRFRQPQRIAFRLRLAGCPSVFSTAVRTAGLRLTWDEALSAQTRELPNGDTELLLTSAEALIHGLFTLMLEWD